MSAALFTGMFLFALAAATATRVWLALRQIGHVRARRDAVPPMFAQKISLEAHRKAADYTVAKARLGIVEVIVGAAALLALTLGGVLQGLIELWGLLLEPFGLLHGTAVIASVFVLSAAVQLPFSIYHTFVIEERFGFNRMTLRLFVSDLLKHAALEAAIGIPIVLVVLWLMAQMGEYWWLYTWLFLIAFSVFFNLVYPHWVMPLFNEFKPISDPQLGARIEALMARCGFRSSGLFEMDGSKRSAHSNAFFVGLGATKRIVLFDTLLRRLLPAEIEAVLAHELGHFKLRHVLKSLVITALLSLASLWILGQLFGHAWFYEGLGVASVSTAAALVLFFGVLPQFTFFLRPLMSRYSRSNEFEADAFAARNASSAELANALVKIYQDNAATLTPDPLHSAFYDSHPPAALRIARLQATT